MALSTSGQLTRKRASSLGRSDASPADPLGPACIRRGCRDRANRCACLTRYRNLFNSYNWRSRLAASRKRIERRVSSAVMNHCWEGLI